MPSTSSHLIQATKRWLQSSGRPEYNRLTAAETATDVSLQFDFALGSIAPGAVLGVDLEEMYVWSVATPSATVQRAWNGSTAAAHALGAIVEVNPLFSNWRIFNEINAELRSLSSPANGLYRALVQLKTATTATTYDLDDDAIKVLSVSYDSYGPSGAWPVLTRWALRSAMWTGEYVSGKALELFEAPDPGRQIYIVYAAPFAPLTALTDDVYVVSGLPESAHDIPAIGAAARLLASRESRRSQIDAQPEPRQAADVPPGSARSASSQLFALRDRRIKEEAAKLSQLYPSRIRRAAV